MIGQLSEIKYILRDDMKTNNWQNIINSMFAII